MYLRDLVKDQSVKLLSTHNEYCPVVYRIVYRRVMAVGIRGSSMHPTLRSFVALGFPALAFLGPFLGHWIGLSLTAQVIVSVAIIVLGSVLRELWQPSKSKHRTPCRARTKIGEPCPYLAAAGEKCCRRHQRRIGQKLRAFTHRNLDRAVSYSLAILFGLQVAPPLIVNFLAQPPQFAIERPAPASITAALKPPKVERRAPKGARVAPPTGLSATVIETPESSASEAPVPLAGLAPAELPHDVLNFISGKTALPTLTTAIRPQTAAPAAPTALMAVVQ